MEHGAKKYVLPLNTWSAQFTYPFIGIHLLVSTTSHLMFLFTTSKFGSIHTNTKVINIVKVGLHSSVDLIYQ